MDMIRRHPSAGSRASSRSSHFFMSAHYVVLRWLSIMFGGRVRNSGSVSLPYSPVLGAPLVNAKNVH